MVNSEALPLSNKGTIASISLGFFQNFKDKPFLQDNIDQVVLAEPCTLIVQSFLVFVKLSVSGNEVANT